MSGVVSPDNTCILACDSLKPFLEMAQENQGTDLPVFWLDRSLHVEPKDMQREGLALIERIDARYTTILVAMGFCGGMWDQVTATRRLVIPRVDDCVSILLSIDDAYQACRKEPWHIYMYEEDPSDFSLERMMNDVGEGEYGGYSQEQLFHMFFDNYRNVDIVDTGLADCYSEGYVIPAQKFADGIGADLDFVQGGVYMLEKLVAGRWDEQFLVAEPGDFIRHGSFFE